MKTVRIFFSSPSDVAEERTIAHRVVRRLQVEFAGAFRFNTVIWEREPLLATAGFQEQLDRPADADIFVAILWSRLGTPLPGDFVRDDGSRFRSGTEFEFEDAFEAFQRQGSPRILVYRKTATPIVALDDEEAVTEHLRQKKSLDRFLSRWFGDDSEGSLRRAVHAFASPGDFEELLEVHLRKLIETLRPESEALANREASWTQGSPFRGLEAFGFEHAPIFFGRTRAVASVLDSLRKQATARRAFVLVVGASGSGKSSLVRAGVVPMLVMPGVVADVDEWRRASMRPSDMGGQPLAALANALCREPALPELRDSDGGSSALREQFERDEFEGLTAVYTALNSQYGRSRKLVLVVDQLEELFGAETIDQETRERFMAVVDALARSGSVWVIATLRSDFYPRCVHLPKLVPLKGGDGQFDMQPPTRPEIGQMIRLPAESAGLAYETDTRSGERLDEKIRDDTADNPKSLPLLEFTLQALYEQRTPEGLLTFKAYRQIGGLEGSLARRAEAVYKSLPRGVRAALPEVLDALAAPADGGAGGLRRKRARLGEITNPDARTMTRAFVDARLFTAELGEDEDAIVDVAHEALLDHWPRVLDWASVNQETLLAHRRLATATRNWVESGRSRDLLLQRGRPISEARMLMAREVSLDRDERAFIDASLSRSRQLRWLRYAATSSVAVFAIVAVIAAWLATEARDEAERRREEAQTMVSFMLQDLRERLEPIGRLDLLDSVVSTVLETLRAREPGTLRDDELASLGLALRQAGDGAAERGERETAAAFYQESLGIARELHRREPDNPRRLFELGNAWFGVGYVAYWEGDVEAARPAFEAYLDVARRLVRQHPENETYRMELNYAESNMGSVEFDQRNFARALEHFEASAAIGRRLAEEHPDNLNFKVELSESLSWLSSAQEQIGEFRAALATRREATTIDARIVAQAPDDRRWRNAQARSKFLLGQLLVVLDDEAAIGYIGESVEELRALVEHDPENENWALELCFAHTDLARAYYQFGREHAALAHAQNAVDMARALHEADPDIPRRWSGLVNAQLVKAKAMHALGDGQGALATTRAAISRTIRYEQAGYLLASLTLLEARLLDGQGPAAGFERALELAADGLPLSDAYNRALWSEIYLRAGRTEEARAAVAELLAAGYRERDFLAACRSASAFCDQPTAAR